MKIASSIAISVCILSLCSAAVAKPMQVILRLKEKIPLEQLAANVMDPNSDRYQKYYTPEEIRDLAGPTKAEFKKLKRDLKSQGMTIVYVDKTHLFLTVETDSKNLEEVFSTQLLSATSNETGMEETVLAAPVNIPSSLDLVDSVIGLDTSKHRHPHLIANAHPMAGTDVPPATIKTLYGFDSLYASGLTGKGQDIAIATYDGFNVNDVKQYYSKIKLKPTPKVDQVVFNGKPAVNEDSAVETEVDAEFSGMIAPGAKIHVFGSSHNDDAGEVQIFTAILDDNRAKVANYSWGMCETAVAPAHKTDMDKVFARAIAQGVNIMVASGDSGSDGCQDGTNAADWPAAHPGVVAVGGTTANVTNGKLDESAWNGSGGGISALYTIPTWQAGLAAPYNTHRSFPDVAFNADPNTGENAWVKYQSDKPDWVQIGGTSIAAPQWSGFMALVNQARAEGNKGAMGPLNAAIYAMSAAERSQIWHDVTQGNNGAFNAGQGWDAVTGWGSMQAANLLDYLRNL